MFLKRACLRCARSGIKTSKISLPVPIDCEYCGAEHKVDAPIQSLPHLIAGGLLLALIVAWFSGWFSRGLFVLLFGAWLILDLLWGRFVPLRLVEQENIEG